MIAQFVAFVSACQFLIYFINYCYKLKIPEGLLLTIVLLFYYLYAPSLFYPEPNPNGINCGMPIIGITLAMWLSGTTAGIATHVCWQFIARLISPPSN